MKGGLVRSLAPLSLSNKRFLLNERIIVSSADSIAIRTSWLGDGAFRDAILPISFFPGFPRNVARDDSVQSQGDVSVLGSQTVYLLQTATAPHLTGSHFPVSTGS